MDVRGYPTCFMKPLAISIVAALCSGMAVPASALPNTPHAFAKREFARCGGDVAQASKHYRYRNTLAAIPAMPRAATATVRALPEADRKSFERSKHFR